METPFYTNAFFWALVSMLGMVAATSLFSRQSLRRSPLFVGLALTLVTAGRLVLVLPFCPQPRFDLAGWNAVAGGAIVAIALGAAAVPVLIVRWWSPPASGMKLRTTGIYGVVRHPIYFAEVVGYLGWSIVWGSAYGVALTPVWWFAFLIHTLAEEAELERTLGASYADYMKKVRGRIFPGVPF